jgi:hypothetical protein
VSAALVVAPFVAALLAVALVFLFRAATLLALAAALLVLLALLAALLALTVTVILVLILVSHCWFLSSGLWQATECLPPPVKNVQRPGGFLLRGPLGAERGTMNTGRMFRCQRFF